MLKTRDDRRVFYRLSEVGGAVALLLTMYAAGNGIGVVVMILVLGITIVRWAGAHEERDMRKQDAVWGFTPDDER